MVWLCGKRLWRTSEQSNGNKVMAEGLCRVGSKVAPEQGPFLEGNPTLEAETAACSVHITRLHLSIGDPGHTVTTCAAWGRERDSGLRLPVLSLPRVVV